MELALYHPEVGYYATTRPRIGRDRSADFYTATSLGSVFGELVAAAAVELIKPATPGQFIFVEVGAERMGTGAEQSARGILDEVAHPFHAVRKIALGESLQTGFVADGPAIVFSNELFDAQPCHRLVWRAGNWREMGVALREGILVDVELPELSPPIAAIRRELPPTSVEGYRLDLPLASRTLLRQLVAAPWPGLFLAFDYGKPWESLSTETPQGTVRAYFRHQQSAAVLDRPGEQDLTCHICWDWLAADLESCGFAKPVVESQEAFFARRAAGPLAAMLTADASRLTARKQAIMQLLHPANMGHKFQVISALRK